MPCCRRKTNHPLMPIPQLLIPQAEVDITKTFPYSNALPDGNISEVGYAASHSFD